MVDDTSLSIVTYLKSKLDLKLLKNSPPETGTIYGL